MNQRDGVDRRAMLVLSGTHLFTDVGQGSVPALLPFFHSHYHWSLAALSALVLAATVSSSVIQPLFGHLSDRVSLPWLMPLGPGVGGLGIGLTGIAGTYPLTFAAILLSGVGVAAFHPEGSRYANYVSGSRRSSGMSLFSVGGNVGFALGPVMMTPLLLVFGLSGTLFVLIPTLAMATVTAFELPQLVRFRPARSVSHAHDGQQAELWRPFVLLAAVIATRSLVYFGMVTFIPLYYVSHLHTSKTLGNVALSAMLLGGAAGTLIGGPLADRFGRREVLIGSMLLVPGLLAGFLLSGPTLAVVFAALAGAATVATFAVTIVMGQEYLPGRLGVAAGVTIGLSIGLGGVGAPLLGVLADADGLPSVFELIAVLPLIGLLLTLGLPRQVRTPATATTTVAGAHSVGRSTV